MALYRQITRIGDNAGEIVWEFVVSADYNELIGSTAEISEVDIFDYESIKFDAEDNSLRQKEDELSFGMNEATISTPADEAAAALIKTSQYSDVWVALFAHDATDWQATSRSADKLLFSGLIRRKSSGQDLIWHGDEWSNAPAPLRSWKYSAQSFGEAVLDKINLTSKKMPNGNIIQGVLDEIDLTPDIRDLPIIQGVRKVALTDFTMPVPTFKWAIHLNTLLRKIIARAVERQQSRISGFEIELIQSETSFAFGNSGTPFTNSGAARRFPLLVNTEEDNIRGLFVDSRLIKPLRAEDGIGIAPDYQISWHRFENVSDLFYHLAICFGCQLKISQVGKSKLRLEFKTLKNEGKELEIIDAVSGSVDLQQLDSTSAKKYVCRATDLNEEGESYNVNQGEYLTALREIRSDKEDKKPLPLSVSATWQMFESEGRAIPQNCDSSHLVSYKVAWTGLIGWVANCPTPSSDIPQNKYSILNRVTDNNSIKNWEWFRRLTDCLDSKITSNNDKYKAEYSIDIPAINGIRAKGLSGNILDVKIFDKIEIDGKNYLIVGIEIKPREGRVNLRLTHASKYGWTEISTPPPFGKTSIPFSDNSFNNFTPIETFLTAEAINAGDLVMLSSERKIKKYENKTENYGRYVGVAATSAVAGAQVVVRNSGTSAGVGLSIGKPVYARIVGGVCKPSPQRLTARSTTEQTDICIGWAKSVDSWELRPPIEFELTN